MIQKHEFVLLFFSHIAGKDTTDKGAEEPKGPISSKNQVSPTGTLFTFLM